MKVSWTLILKCTLFVVILDEGMSEKIDIDFTLQTKTMKILPRFWTNVGFSPPEPVEKVDEFFAADDVNRNLEIIGSLPNGGIENVRIHWLLNLLSIKNYTSKNLPIFEFTQLDKFLTNLINDYRLKPTIEFMTSEKFQQINFITWMDFSYQILSRYIGYYGMKSIEKWKFESWNEPDLRGYNRLNFTSNEFHEYIKGVRMGIKAAERLYGANSTIKFRGPAGLFKDFNHHKFCWGLMEICNENLSKCPVDIITFHRKGSGNNAEEILNGSLDLLKTFKEKYPKLIGNMKFSNTEADPIKKWSEARDFQADMRYAAILISTVFEHWQRMFDGSLKNFESLSHDNAFLNYFPHIFTQRTLLARFQMNNTTPRHVQFIQKPVFSALGLIANVGVYGSEVKVVEGANLSFIVTTNSDDLKFYSNIIIWSQVDVRNEYKNKSRKVEIRVTKVRGENLFYFVEGIDNKRTNPSKVYEDYGKPAFPDSKLFKFMRKTENPIILEQPTKVVDGKILLDFQLMAPFLISIRICNKHFTPSKITNLRIRRVNDAEILIFWSQDEISTSNCIKSYEIFFRYMKDENFHQLETGHIPFLYHQIYHTIPGCFKIRSRDFFDDFSEFSSEKCF